MTEADDPRSTGAEAGEAAAAADAGPEDAALIALCGRILANNAESDRLCEPYYEVVDGWRRHPEVAARVDALVGEYHGMLAEMAGIPARTPAGLRAKADVLALSIDPDGDGEPDSRDLDGDEAVLWSLIRDIRALVPAAAPRT